MPSLAVRSQSVEEPNLHAAEGHRLLFLDVALVLLFLALVFLLGVFPLKDVDFWWHLRTGDWIRETGTVPRTDLYTYTVPDNPWVDLHWIFQVLLSLGYEQGGVIFLNLAKCVVTTLALLMLVTARRLEWPFWVMIPAWIPALIVLGGRMYIRPETLTLLYLAAFLAILFRIDRKPLLIFLLPLIQVLWVNTQGLFVFGPMLLVLRVLDLTVRPSAIEGDPRRWWRIVWAGGLLTGLACLLNPYGLTGALFPLQLFFGTMSDPIFKQSIAELSSIPKLIADTAGYPLFMLQVHLAVIVLGGLSFVVPGIWSLVARWSGGSVIPEATPISEKPRKRGKKKAKAPAKSAKKIVNTSRWSLSLFRLLLFAIFTALSWQATRNSHQFAAVVGCLTAWNLGEWAAAMRKRREEKNAEVRPGILPRLAAIASVGVVLAFVGTGTLYEWAEEGRTIGLGEEPAWFPHDAVRFAGQESLPPRFLSLHIGHAALFLHDFGPERKVFADPRLEVMGPEQYGRYLAIQEALGTNSSRAEGLLDAAQRPVVLIDHLHNSGAGVSLLELPGWECVYFGPVAAVYAHQLDAKRAGLSSVDFLARHFGLQPAESVQTLPDALSVAKACSHYVLRLLNERGRADLADPMVPLGLDYARRARELDSKSAEAWAASTTLELTRGSAGYGEPVARYREPLDPMLDLHDARVAYFGRKALELDPDHALANSSLATHFLASRMDEAAFPMFERMASQAPRTQRQAITHAQTVAERDAIARRLATASKIDTSNGIAIQQSLERLLREGRVESAANLLEEQFPVGERTWPVADQLATLRLHLGQPEAARAAWQSVARPPQAGLKLARIAATYYVQDELDQAREAYLEAIKADPKLLEAHHGLALVEFDAGRADASAAAARAAMECAQSEAARSQIERLLRTLNRFTRDEGGSGE